MSKELPYFKFFPNEWMSGDITLEAMSLQGIFINVCSTYWSKDCNIEIAKLKARYGKAIASLLEKGLIKQEQGFCVISFLDEQWEELSKYHKKNSENGKKGANKRWGGDSEANGDPIALRGEESKGEEKRKEKKRKEPSEPSSGIYQSCIDLYFKWHEDKLGGKPQFDASDGKGLKAAIKHFNTLEAGDEAVLKNFNALLSNYDKWDKWHRTQTRLRQINSNLTNIINVLKNGQSKPTANDFTEEWRKQTNTASFD